MTTVGDIRVLENFFHLLEIDAKDAGNHPDAFDRLRQGKLHGVLVHNVYTTENMSSVVERLERHDPPFIKTWFPDEFKSWFYGQNLNLSPPNLVDYFHQALMFHRHMQSLFPETRGIRTHLAQILSQLSGGKPFQSPPGPNPGEEYMFTTIRGHLPGGFIPPHFDNEQALRPSYQHLKTMIEPHIFSFVLALTLPETGGALEIFNFTMNPAKSTLVNDDGASLRFDPNRTPSVQFRIPPGSVIVVDSGQFLHQLTPVEGQTKRWTVCSFMAQSKDGRAVYCWG